MRDKIFYRFTRTILSMIAVVAMMVCAITESNAQAIEWEQRLAEPGGRAPNASRSGAMGQRIFRSSDGDYYAVALLSGPRQSIARLGSDGTPKWHRSYSWGGDTTVDFNMLWQNQNGEIVAGGILSPLRFFGLNDFGLFYRMIVDSDGFVTASKVSFDMNGGCFVTFNYPYVSTLDATGSLCLISGLSRYEMIFIRSAPPFCESSFSSYPNRDTNLYTYQSGDIRTTANGDILTVGAWMAPYYTYGRLVVMRLDSTGGVHYEYDIQNDSNDLRRARGIAPARGNAAMVLSVRREHDSLNQRLRMRSILTKLSPTGEVLWEREYLFAGEQGTNLTCLAATSDGGFVAAGATAYRTSDSVKLVVVRFDGDGELLWERTWGHGRHYNSLWDIIEAEPGAYVVTGESGAGLLCIALLRDGSSSVDRAGGAEDDTVKANADNHGVQVWWDGESIVVTSHEESRWGVYDIMGNRVGDGAGTYGTVDDIITGTYLVQVSGRNWQVRRMVLTVP